jgi:hypothetical protein
LSSVHWFTGIPAINDDNPQYIPILNMVKHGKTNYSLHPTGVLNTAQACSSNLRRLLAEWSTFAEMFPGSTQLA